MTAKPSFPSASAAVAPPAAPHAHVRLAGLGGAHRTEAAPAVVEPTPEHHEHEHEHEHEHDHRHGHDEAGHAAHGHGGGHVHSHAHAHAHAPVATARPGASLLRMSLVERLAIAGLVSGVIWLGVFWASRPIGG